MNAPPNPPRQRATALQIVGWTGLGVLLVVAASVTYALVVLVGK